MRPGSIERKLADQIQRASLRRIGRSVLGTIGDMTPALLMQEPIEIFIVYADAAHSLGFRGVHGVHRAFRRAWPDVCSAAAEAASALARGDFE